MGKASSLDSWVAPALVVTATLASSLLIWKRIKRFRKELCITISQIHIYPIKSCEGKALNCAIPADRGFRGDRILQVTDENGRCCTPREPDKAKLFHIRSELNGNCLALSAPNMKTNLHLDLVQADTTPVRAEVIGLSKQKFALQDYGNEAASWLENATGIPKCRLTGIGPKFNRLCEVNPKQGDIIPDGDAPLSLADEAPYLLVNEASLDDLNRRLKARGKSSIKMDRFRPNIVLTGLEPWQEDCLKKIQINNVQFHVWQRCGRCTMTTINRETLERGPEPLSTLSIFRERENGMRNFGMHLIPVCPIPNDATVVVGDHVKILEYDHERLVEWRRLFG